MQYQKLEEYRKGLFTTLVKPLNKKHMEEASRVNITLISEKSLIQDGKIDQNYKWYEFNDCKHRQFLQPTHVRRNHIDCDICFEEQIAEAASQRGFTVLSKTNDALFRVMKRDKCGHISNIRHSNMKSKSLDDLDYKCSQCLEIRFEQEALEKNLTYLGTAINKTGIFRHYRFNTCGHTRDINPAAVARSAIDCQQCKEDKYKQSAENAGLVYIGACKVKSDCKRTYQLPCGHNKELRMDHARDGSYLCDICGDSHYTKPSSIYLLRIKSKDGFSWLKLGYAHNITLRKTNYKLDRNSDVYLVKVVDTPTGAIASSNERKWHKQLRKLKVNSKFMQNYHKGNGHTECYPLEVESIILELMNNLHNELNNKEKELCGN